MVGTRLVSPCLRRHQCVSAPVSLRCTPPHTRPIRRLEARRTAAPDDWDAEEAALDAESVDPFAENEDDGDVEYPPELSLEDTDRLSFVDDPDEFWRLVMDEEAYDDKLFKLAVADSGAATKPSVLARMEKQKPRIAIEKYLELLPKLQEREGFVSDIAHTYEPVVETIPDPLPRHRTNPDWDEWDFRALLEDQRQRAAVDAAWNAERAEIGRFHYEVPSWPDDLRFKDRPAHEEDTSEWDEERIMALITQDGRSPRIEEVCVVVLLVVVFWCCYCCWWWCSVVVVVVVALLRCYSCCGVVCVSCLLISIVPAHIEARAGGGADGMQPECARRLSGLWV